MATSVRPSVRGHERNVGNRLRLRLKRGSGRVGWHMMCMCCGGLWFGGGGEMGWDVSGRVWRKVPGGGFVLWIGVSGGLVGWLGNGCW